MVPDHDSIEMLMVVDGEERYWGTGWPFSDAKDFESQVDQLKPGWKRFAIFYGRVKDGSFSGVPWCGMRKN